MSAREELAAVLAGQTVRVQVVNVGTAAGFLRAESALHLADALLASPALADLIRQAKAEAWDEGRRTGSSRAIRKMSDEPGLPLASAADNPYRVEVEGGA